MHPLALKRVLAFAIDWLLFAVWAGVVFAVVTLGVGVEWAEGLGLLGAQALSFFGATLPFAVYMAGCHASRRGATVGKRVLRLEVRATEGGRLGFGRALGRELLKFVPWELGHLQVNLVLHERIGPALYVVIGVLWLLVFVYAVQLAGSGRALYDRVVGSEIFEAKG